MKSFSTVGIFSKPHGDRVVEALHTLHALLTAKNLKIVASEAPAKLLGLPPCTNSEIGHQADIAIVIGGDGTLLTAGRLMAHYHVPLVGINLGRLGFLVDILPDELTQMVSDILNGQYIEEKRPLLRARAFRDRTFLGEGIAVNEVALHARNEVRMIEFNTYIDNVFVTNQSADGLIVTTPTGSTAYALSSGGPIMHPSLHATALVPICPHILSSRPLVVHSQSRIKIELVHDRPVDSRLSFDGHHNIELRSGDHVTIHTRRGKMCLLHPRHYDYYHILRTKLHWGT